eukprot:4064791-Pleurochrysis_carterae.AAC.1
MQLRPGGTAAREWIELLDVATGLLDANEGVPLAPQAVFPASSDTDVITITTDASGIDGVGGYAF